MLHAKWAASLAREYISYMVPWFSERMIPHIKTVFLAAEGYALIRNLLYTICLVDTIAEKLTIYLRAIMQCTMQTVRHWTNTAEYSSQVWHFWGKQSPWEHQASTDGM